MTTTKEDYERLLNQLLGLDIRWSKLSKEELSALATLFSSPRELARRLGLKTDRNILRRRFIDILDNLGLKGPFVTFLRDLLKEEE